MEDLSHLYRYGRLDYDRDELNRLGLSQTTIDFLVEFGLPKSTKSSKSGKDEDIVWGLVFQENLVLASDQKIVIAKEWENQQVEIDPSNDQIVGSSEEGTYYINKDIQTFFAALADVDSYFATDDRTRTDSYAKKQGKKIRKSIRQSDPAAVADDTFWDNILFEIEENMV